MHDIAYPLVAIRDDGTTIIAATPDEAVAFNQLRPGTHHVHAYLGFDDRLRFDRTEWIVRDHFGRIVHQAELPHEDRPRRARLQRRLDAVRDAAARGLPIPGTGPRRRLSRGYRGYRTNIAARAAEAALAADLADWDVEDVRVGRARNHDLPQVWDDVDWRRGRRSWKDQRRTQWR